MVQRPQLNAEAMALALVRSIAVVKAAAVSLRWTCIGPSLRHGSLSRAAPAACHQHRGHRGLVASQGTRLRHHHAAADHPILQVEVDLAVAAAADQAAVAVVTAPQASTNN